MGLAFAACDWRVDEEIIALEDNDEETPKKRKKKRVDTQHGRKMKMPWCNDDDPKMKTHMKADPALNYDWDNQDNRKVAKRMMLKSMRVHLMI